MNEIISKETGEITRSEPGQKAMRVHITEAGEKAAKRTGDVEAIERAVRLRLEAQREFALEYKRIYPDSRDTGGRAPELASGTSETYCQSHGFALRTVQRWCERLIDEAKLGVEFHQIMQKVLRLVQLEQAANFMSESVEWYTPGKYIESVREALGEIDLDPASSEQANRTVKAKEFFGAEQDGLALDWYGRVFVNPPYGKSEEHGSLAGAFCNKAMAEYESGNAKACIILVNSLHSQNWQAALYDYTVCFVDHRIQFISADGEENKSPTFQNIFIYLGQNEKKFAEAFQKHGYVMRKIHQ